MRARDSQRSRCYRAERAAVARVPGESFGFVPHAQSYADRVLRSDWWWRNAWYPGPVMVVENKRTTRAFAREWLNFNGRWWRFHPNINLPARTSGAWAWTDWVLLHELAHIARFSPGGRVRFEEAAHSPEWAGTFLVLVREFMGSAAADALEAEFAAHRVRHVQPGPLQQELPGFAPAIAARER